ncbi:PREDICTED: tumor necrosis factor receptor superfamily member 5 isoform X2 [Condylura cristata]|uniref:tumor necrosis factor receptor superfamily member 5 isoform X2 n=1 Tax=Condylura cristata TaxID=143302 RepID=UPI000642AE46|nr:PREDICTED: tumor necrosis factor receptor superfamily member 5 isoform X2 [Condylura cristata]
MVCRPLQCLFWGCLVTAIHPEPSTVCKENQYLQNNLCCNLCQPGQKLVKDCTETAQTECISCSEAEFQDAFNKETRCHQHRYCDPNLGLQIRTPGTLQTDTTCKCEEGQHCVGHDCDNCFSHSPCLPGYGVQRMATEVSDTVCEPCPVGFFSNVSSALEKCNPWTSCEAKGMAELQAGTTEADAVCEKVAKKPEEEVIHFKTKSCPVEIEDSSPVQETLHGCQPVTQEDGKESRISVQERL